MRLVRITALFAFCLAACSTSHPSGSPDVSSISAPTSTPSPTVGLATFVGPNLTFTYPADWHAVDVTDVVELGGSSSIAVLANFPLAGCGANDINCLFALKVPLSGLLVHVGVAHNFASIFDPDERWTETIDGMPARMTSQPGYLGIDENRAWIVAVPGGIWGQLGVEASIRGPGIAAIDGAVDAIAHSVRFDVHPTTLDLADSGRVLTAGMQYIDRLSQGDLPVPTPCFPTKAGEHQTLLRTWWGVALKAPVAVTCATSIEATSVELWRVTLSVRWAAGPQRVADVWREDVYFDAQGVWIGRVRMTPDASPLSTK